MNSSPTSDISPSLNQAYQPCGLKAGEELQFYLDDSQGTYLWLVNYKQFVHRIQYAQDQAYLRAGDTHTLRALFSEQLGSINSSLKLTLEIDPNSEYILKARSYAVWELRIYSSSSTTSRLFILARRAGGWDFHAESAVTPLLAAFRKRPLENKLGSLVFYKDIDEGALIGLVFGLTFAISTANARFHLELGIPASTEFDRIDKYGDLAEYRTPPKPSPSISLFTRSKLLNNSKSCQFTASDQY